MPGELTCHVTDIVEPERPPAPPEVQRVRLAEPELGGEEARVERLVVELQHPLGPTRLTARQCEAQVLLRPRDRPGNETLEQVVVRQRVLIAPQFTSDL